MPQFPQGFSARTIEPATGGSQQLPVSSKDGWPVIITGSEMVATSGNANNGMMVFDISIIDGDHKGQEGTYRLNLYHDNEKVQNIAWAQLSALCHVTGAVDAASSEQLYNRPFRVLVRLQKNTEAAEKGYTEIYGVLDINGNKPGKGGATQQAPAPAPAPPPPPAPAPAPAPAPPPAPAPAPQGDTWANQAPVQEQQPAGAPAWASNPAPGATPPWGQK